LGTLEDKALPVKIGGKESFGSGVRMASENKQHSIVLTEDRHLWTFGNAEFGRLGLGNMSFIKSVRSPHLVDSQHFGARRISVINAGKGHSGVFTEDGAI
jgi:alpha-tubulin suppressor-like RCC1 family protein